MAERQGFEPWIGVTYTHFPGVRLQPLGHLSVHNYLIGTGPRFFNPLIYIN